MFDKELYEIVLKDRESKLNDAKAQNPVNQDEVDNLTKEVNYLKATLIRYKIAVLLGLSNDSSYTSSNYLGIEEEDVNDFNLNSTDLAEYNSLIAQIPKDQLQLYKVRKRMAEFLNPNISDKYKENDYVGIEKINPNLTKYNLTQEQIREYRLLIAQAIRIGSDTTKKVDVEEAALEIMKDIFNKLNIDDIDQYNSIKDNYLDTIDGLINHIDQDKKDSIFTGASNYNLVIDLKQKYPDLNISMDIKGVTELLKLLETDLEEDVYNDYLTLFCQSINTLYQDPNNKDDIERLINGIDKNNYLLRSDLSSRININNVDLKLKDDELKDVFEYLDRNYNHMPEEDREKYYLLVESKITNNISDLDKVGEINKLLLSVNNDDLSNRLKGKFSNNKYSEFKDEHLNSYQSLVQSEIAKLEARKKVYENKTSSSGNINSYYETKARELQKEIDTLKGIKEDYSGNVLLETLDSTYNKQTDKIIKIEKEIMELKQLKEQVNSKFHKKAIDNRILKENNRIKQLQQRQGKIVGVQKTIMAPKLWIDQKRNKADRYLEARKDVLTDYSNDYQKMADNERNLGGMFSEVKATFYEFQSKRYGTKAELNQKMFDMLSDAKVTIKGRMQQMINKNTLDQLRQRQQQQVQTQTI